MDLDKITNSLKEKYPDLGISKIDIDDSKGTSTFYIQPKKSLPFIQDPSKAVTHRFSTTAATIRRPAIDRNYLDLRSKPSPYSADPKELFTKAMTYYKENPIVGSAVNTLVFLCAKGFENDIDDDEIKMFFDVWCHDVNFQEVLEWIYTDLIKVGHVFTYKTTTQYTKRESKLSPVPGVSLGKANGKVNDIVNSILKEVIKEATKYGISGDALKELELAASKKAEKETQIPVAYTVLNPLSIDIEGSMFFDSTNIVMNVPDDVIELLKKPKKELNDSEKELIDLLPKEFKKQALDDGKVLLDRAMVGQITYMKQPYERYASPRLTRTFDSLEYKQALINADLSTVDGISNYILKITIGNDEYPVVSQNELEAVAKLFNTPSKSFDVVWNHTLKIEKIVSPEIDKILGQGKYEQVEDDISAGIAVMRALIDGKLDGMSTAQISILLKGLAEEINYLRRLVTRWIYSEYKKIAEVVGFERFPRIRWDESILKDTIMYMTVISQLVDRRMLSYRTAHETLGFDYSTELNNMEKEFQLVQDGLFGLRGSPWQQNKGVQPTQEAPEGTPSDGRPKGKPAKKKEKPAVEEEETKASLSEIKKMSDGDFLKFITELSKIRMEED